jgi:putative ABC transport system permease protein
MYLEDIKESALMAFSTLRANKLRSALTILGISIGIIAVLFMVSIIQGLNRSFAQTLESMGSNIIFISRFDPSIHRDPTAEERQRKDLTIADADAIRREAPSIISVSPIRRVFQTTVRYMDRQTDSPALAGVTSYYEETHTNYVGRGRFISDMDVIQRSRVCVLGTDVAQSLFPYEEAIGAEVKIDGGPFRVVGIMEPLGSFFGQSRDNVVYIPLSTFDEYHPDPFKPGTIIVLKPISRAHVQMAVDEATDILRRRRRVPTSEPDNFSIMRQDSLLDIYNQLTGATALVLTAVSFVALMIGGIGVMNIMLVSVTERTREIGIRKAVGATRSNILWQFLIEAITLTAIGGVAGLFIGEIISLLMNRFSPLPAYIPAWAILVGLSVSAGVGIIFGLWPAWKAARLDPIEALRYE